MSRSTAHAVLNVAKSGTHPPTCAIPASSKRPAASCKFTYVYMPCAGTAPKQASAMGTSCCTSPSTRLELFEPEAAAAAAPAAADITGHLYGMTEPLLVDKATQMSCELLEPCGTKQHIEKVASNSRAGKPRCMIMPDGLIYAIKQSGDCAQTSSSVPRAQAPLPANSALPQLPKCAPEALAVHVRRLQQGPTTSSCPEPHPLQHARQKVHAAQQRRAAQTPQAVAQSAHASVEPLAVMSTVSSFEQLTCCAVTAGARTAASCTASDLHLRTCTPRVAAAHAWAHDTTFDTINLRLQGEESLALRTCSGNVAAVPEAQAARDVECQNAQEATADSIFKNAYMPPPPLPKGPSNRSECMSDAPSDLDKLLHEFHDCAERCKRVGKRQTAKKILKALVSRSHSP